MPAKLTRVGQASTSTGTGNFTLGAALTTLSPSVQTFSAVAGSGNGLMFFYSIMHKTLNELEDGIGYLSDTNTLVRHRVFRSTNGNALVNFSAGDKDVVCTDQGNLQDTFFGGSPASSVATKWLAPANHGTDTAPAVMTADRLYAIPMTISQSIKVIEWMATVTTAVAGSVVRAAIAERLTRTTYRVAIDLGTIDSSTTGDKVFPAGANLMMPAGSYFILFHSSNTPSLRFRSINNSDIGGQFGTMYKFLFGSLAWSGSWPNPVTGIDTGVNNNSCPAIYFRTEDDYA